MFKYVKQKIYVFVYIIQALSDANLIISTELLTLELIRHVVKYTLRLVFSFRHFMPKYGVMRWL